MPCFVLLDEVAADHSTLSAQMTTAWLGACAAALQTQLVRDVAPYWPYAMGAVVRVGSGPDDVGKQEIPCRILATLPDAPGDIAYHDDADGCPDVFLGLDTCPSLDDVSNALSHETCETCADPNCDQWVTLPSGVVVPFAQIALEVSDPLQDRSYKIDSISVSDFCLPAYFGFAQGPTSYGELHDLWARLEPFARSAGGYQLVRNADGTGETQQWGMMTMARQAKARMVGSRPNRRGWVMR